MPQQVQKLAKKAGKITSQIVTFDVDDSGKAVMTEPLVVRLIDIRRYKGEKIKEECNQYVGEARDGSIKSFLLGGATDKQMMEHSVAVGDCISVMFLGKKALKDGRQVNLFDIEFVDAW